MKVQQLLSFALSTALTAEAVAVAPARSAGEERAAKIAARNAGTKHLRFEKRQQSGFSQGEPFDGKGKGSVFSSGTNHFLDVSNPDNLGAESTDAGVVPNLKWSFSDSHTRLLNGGWVREQVITDLPASGDISGAQLHLTKGSIRELHWHRVAEWGFVTAGSIEVSAVDEYGRNQYELLKTGDIWYFPKGEAHSFQGLEDQNEVLLAFDDGNFDASGTTFLIDDWIAHTPKDILAQNFGVNQSVFANIPTPDPYIVNGTHQNDTVASPFGKLTGNLSYVYHSSQIAPTKVPGGGGTVKIVDSTVFPIATTIASNLVTIEPGALRELHWHPNAEEWLYFFQGTARASVFIGGATARTFDFSAGDTAVFPDNSGHYIQNTSKNETLVFLELYKSNRVIDISLTQWLALTPASIVSQVLKIPLSVAQNLKQEKQLIVKAQS